MSPQVVSLLVSDHMPKWRGALPHANPMLFAKATTIQPDEEGRMLRMLELCVQEDSFETNPKRRLLQAATFTEVSSGALL